MATTPVGPSTAVRTGLVVGLLVTMSVIAFSVPASANNEWGGYHWARSVNPFTLTLGDNVGASWDPILRTTSTDWSASPVLDTSIVAGSTNPKTCKASAGQVQVCNAKYGRNGWLGIAQIWITGGVHITQGAVKLNDTYFSTAAYNTTAWRNLVSCQEVGHTLGLAHQDEAFDNANLGTCMDYTNNPTTNQHPNAHDYEELQAIYSHVDASTTLASSAAASNPGKGGRDSWGRAVARSKDHRTTVYELDLPHGEKVITFVISA